MFIYINKCLQEIEKEYNVEILFVCELGSCVYGFDMLVSDFDVCFIYKYKVLCYFYFNRF